MNKDHRMDEENVKDRRSRGESNREGLIDADKNEKDGTILREAEGDGGTMNVKEKEVHAEKERNE